MPGPVYKDSWGRCEPPSMLYDVIRNPRAPAPKLKVEGVATSKDTLEGTQQRMNREMMERLQRGGLRLPHHSFVAALQVGKYLILAIMLPSYLCFFGIPRWVLTQLLPLLFFGIKNEMLRIGRFFNEMGKRVADLMKGILEQMIGDALKLAKRSAQQMLHPLKLLSEMAAKAAGRMKGEWVSAFKRLRKGVMQPAKNAWERLSQRIDGEIEKWKKTLNRSLERLVQSFEKHISIPLWNGGIRHLAKLVSAAESAGQKTSRAFAHVKRQIGRALKPAAAFTGKMVRKIKRHLRAYFQPHLDWAREKMEKAQAFLERKWDEASSIVHGHLQAIIVKLQNAMAFVPWAFAQGVQTVWKHTPQSIKDRMKKRGAKFKRWIRKTGDFCRWMAKKLQKCASAGNKLKERVGQASLRILSWIYRLFNWLKRLIIGQILALPRRAKRFVFSLGRFGLRLLGMTVIGARVVVAFICALCGYGRLLAKELIAEMALLLQK